METKIETKKETKKESNRVVIAGELCKWRWQRGYKGKGEEQWRISLKITDPEINDKVKKALELTGMDVNDTFTPNWLKKVNPEYLNTHTAFSIPVELRNGSKKFSLDMESVCEGAKVKLALTCKDTGIYPAAMIVEENGTPYNPFECFE